MNIMELRCHNCNIPLIRWAARYVTKHIIEGYCVVCRVTNCYMDKEGCQ